MSILAIVLLAVAAGIAFLNMQTMTTLNLYFTSLTLPLWMILLGALLLGMLAAWLLAGAAAAARRNSLKEREEELQAELDRKEEELAAARRDKEDIADRTRLETEKDYELRQKDEEIESLNARLARMENQMHTTQAENTDRTIHDTTTIHETTPETKEVHSDDVVVVSPGSDRVVYRDTGSHDGLADDSRTHDPADPEIAADPSQANVSASDKPDGNPKRPL